MNGYDEPTGMFALKEILRRDVGQESIPNNHRFFIEMMMQLNQPENKIPGHARTVHDREMKFHFATCRRCADEAEAGLILPRECFAKHRRLADLSPLGRGRVECSEHEQLRCNGTLPFIHKNQGCAEFLRFFLCVSTHYDTSETPLRRNTCAT